VKRLHHYRVKVAKKESASTNERGVPLSTRKAVEKKKALSPVYLIALAAMTMNNLHHGRR
jgi:hypothetical protein